MNRYDLVLLGLILEKDCCGYDIITQIRERELDRWAKISTSTVYTRLAKLEKTGFIVGHIEREGNRPERTVYSLAEKGLDLFRKEVVRHLTGFNDDPRTLGFAFLYGIEPKEVVRALEAQERQLLREVERLNKMIEDEPKPTLYPEGPFLNCMSRDHILVELKYVRAAISILKDPSRNTKLDRYFGINFGARNFNQQD
ncbi:MAG: PadR family transcriptional regulator [Fibrobacteraceae bacterium]|jgi:DNA-binding PadR family transcriptional regulator|nr:PadR family transcriptional regulator [Fibrobacteraceae bacterium]MBQ5611926.1 PadR family transcriptional regulator [Fibrobacteraceae bacterium]MEE0876347.1 PadR family transcriptional regulator [Fibrobacteraceae bacterium]